MLIYLVRHGEADLGTGVPYHLFPGPPLTAAGRDQAEESARLLRHAGIERVVSSPMRRCRETAEPLCALLDLELHTDDDAGELQPGERADEQQLRMLRALVSHGGCGGLALVGHASPLEQLLGALTRGTAELGAPDGRGARIAPGEVWQLARRDGAWRARRLASGGEVL